MDDKEKIDKALEIIKSKQEFQEIQKLEWEKDKDATEQVFQGLWDSDANRFVNTYFETQKDLLEKLKKSLKGDLTDKELHDVVTDADRVNEYLISNYMERIHECEEILRSVRSGDGKMLDGLVNTSPSYRTSNTRHYVNMLTESINILESIKKDPSAGIVSRINSITSGT